MWVIQIHISLSFSSSCHSFWLYLFLTSAHMLEKHEFMKLNWETGFRRKHLRSEARFWLICLTWFRAPYCPGGLYLCWIYLRGPSLLQVHERRLCLGQTFCLCLFHVHILLASSKGIQTQGRSQLLSGDWKALFVSPPGSFCPSRRLQGDTAGQVRGMQGGAGFQPYRVIFNKLFLQGYFYFIFLYPGVENLLKGGLYFYLARR